ncbi:MAG: hypothetical protein JEZ08_00630 [Clostridiales bacterium]|nr:hypothetical protein [Clostridiales bacterium]
MKNNSRNKLIAIGLISFILIVLMVVYFLKNDAKAMDNTIETIIFIATGILAVGSFLLAVFFRRRQIKLISNLKGSFKEAFEEIIEIISTGNVSQSERQRIKLDILELLFEAQERGDTLEQTIGTDNKQFSMQILEAVGGKMSFLVQMTTGVQYLIAFTLLFKLADNFDKVDSVSSYLKAEVGHSSMFLYVIISLIVIPLMFWLYGKVASQNSLVKTLGIFIGVPILSVGGYELIMLLFRNQFADMKGIESLLNGASPIVTSFAMVMLLITLLILGFVFKRLISRYRIRNIY